MSRRPIDRGTPPPCSCGCGQQVRWDRGRKRWRPFSSLECYRKPALYKESKWLTAQYESGRTLRDIAEEFSVNKSTIKRFAVKYNIELRPPHQRRGINTGSDNPAWKGGVAAWDYSSDWKAIARDIKYRDNWTCQDCHEQRKRWGKYLHVHHINCNKLDNDPSNLISLCDKCHRIRHGMKEVMLV